MKDSQAAEFLLQALEHEKGSDQVYETALKCAFLPELIEEWQKYLEQTRMHARVLTEVVGILKIDLYKKSPGRDIVRQTGAALVKAMESALRTGNREAAQIVACDCVVLAETKDHANWELIGLIAQHLKGEGGEALRNACVQIEEEEDEHLYHSKGWGRELTLQSLGLKAVLPPPEETREVRTAREAVVLVEERTRP